MPRKKRVAPKQSLSDLRHDEEAVDAVRKVWNDPTKMRPSAGDFEAILAQSRKELQEQESKRATYEEMYERTNRAMSSRRGCLSTLSALVVLVAIFGILA